MNTRPSLRNGFTAYNALSPVSRGSVATVAPEQRELPENLTPAYGRQDHTLLPYAAVALVFRNLSVHRNPSNVRDDGRRPSDQDGMAKNEPLICPSGKAKYFLFWGLTVILINGNNFSAGFICCAQTMMRPAGTACVVPERRSTTAGPAQSIRQQPQLDCFAFLIPWRKTRVIRRGCYAARRASSASARYDNASARCSRPILSDPSRSASVRATRSTR